VLETKGLIMVELVGIEPPQWIENMELIDSTMFLIVTKGLNSHSTVQNGTNLWSHHYARVLPS